VAEQPALSFAGLLRQLRDEAQLTQEELADAASLSPRSISDLERGINRTARKDTAVLLADALHLAEPVRALFVAVARGRGPAADVLAARQVVAPGAFAAASRGLPARWTSFVGRDGERAAVRAAMDEVRLVTLVGPGGVGKTRLALEVAQDSGSLFPSGCAFADLVPVREGFVVQAVASVLGVSERPQQPLQEAVLEHLAGRRALLVLDNCEHLLAEAAAFTERLLAACPGVRVLATSRERLAVSGEHTVTVPPLSLVAGVADGMAGSEAALLFIDRARAVDSGFIPAAAVDELCARLEGVPLAIELAAARSASLGLDGLLAGLDDYLRLLAGGRGADPRHGSLRAVIGWSHDLLDDAERAMFRRLGVFAGGFELDAACAISGNAGRGVVADLVGRLADKSLLIATPGGGRWRMLDTVRAYALGQLAASGEEQTLRERHLRWAAETAAALEHRVRAAGGQAQAGWRPRFDAVADDLRAALSAGTGPGPDSMQHRLARSLGHLAYARRYLAEARGHFEQAAGLAPADGQAAADLLAQARVAAAEGTGELAFHLLLASAGRAKTAGDDRATSAALAEAVTVTHRISGTFERELPHSRLRDLLAEAALIAPAEDPVLAAQLAAATAWNARPEKSTPDPRLAAAALAAARRADDPVLISGGLDAAAEAERAAGRYRQAHKLSAERYRLIGRLSRHDIRAGFEISDSRSITLAVAAGDLPGALSMADPATSDPLAADQPMTLFRRVIALALRGDFDAALADATGMWQAWLRAGAPPAYWVAPAAYAGVLVCGLRGDSNGVREWRGRVVELAAGRMRRSTDLFAAFADSRVALHHGRYDQAAAALAGLGIGERPWYDNTQRWDYDAYAWALAAEAAVIAALPGATQLLAAAAPAAQENLWAAACLARANGRLHDDRAALEKSLAGWQRIGSRFERACTLLLLPDRAAQGHAELDALGCPSPVT
jgi:predicted ATPase/transcriptional regulator with XRE-family HTH domain